MKELTKATVLSPLLSDIEFGYVKGLALIGQASPAGIPGMRGVEETLIARAASWLKKLRSPFAEPPCEAKGRFKSVIAGSSDGALLAMSAYVDLNPVRAGIVADLADVRNFVASWYDEACGGSRRACGGLGLGLALQKRMASFLGISSVQLPQAFLRSGRRRGRSWRRWAGDPMRLPHGEMIAAL